MLCGESHPKHKLTEGQVKSIRELWSVGHRNVKVLARNNGVSPANIRKIVKGYTWRFFNRLTYIIEIIKICF